MSAEAAFASLHTGIFQIFGRDVTVVRGQALPAAVRVVLDRNVEIFGDTSQLASRVDVVSFMSAQWLPRQGDVLAVGGEQRKIERLLSDDGYVSKAVLYG
jgi:hypothetical protein